MRISTQQQANLSAFFFTILLLSIVLLPEPSSSQETNNTIEPSKASSKDEPSFTNSLGNPKIELRAPVETPPTEYLPYPPPPNYSWPPGENAGNENPKPSDNNPPAGWNTGQSGSSGSGSGSSAVGASPSAASPALRPLAFFHILTAVLPIFARGARIPRALSQTPLGSPLPSTPSTTEVYAPASAPAIDPQDFSPSQTRDLLSRFIASLFPRSPVETPPTEYLPYPPPPNYSWPPGENPSNENPPPTEFNPPAGWYGGNGNGQGASGSTPDGGSKPLPSGQSASDTGGVVRGYGDDHKKLAPGAIAGICVAGAVFLAVITISLWWASKRFWAKRNQNSAAAPGGGAAEMGHAPGPPGPFHQTTQDSEVSEG